ncbi:hypothetical protein FEK35_15050 [Nocardia cyriacigeorgica]|uniref:Uncharacterized protein n=1 Tax=Nocardia cyriacigeorgica TaxID=135487 RepID=A0A5R8PDN8_9NOCA|nr:hypothetical protein [Nocardia cyriacigeorgica]TLG09441.1 hypothetical protein FEK35_15050 [Nocardia cyriacigeorgica]
MNDNLDTLRASLRQLRQEVFTEPAAKTTRPALVEYLHAHATLARSIPPAELYAGQGDDIAADICGALAWPGAEGVDGDDWITADSEPGLWRALELSSELDINSNNPAVWQELLDVIDRLQS